MNFIKHGSFPVDVGNTFQHKWFELGQDSFTNLNDSDSYEQLSDILVFMNFIKPDFSIRMQKDFSARMKRGGVGTFHWQHKHSEMTFGCKVVYALCDTTLAIIVSSRTTGCQQSKEGPFFAKVCLLVLRLPKQ